MTLAGAALENAQSFARIREALRVREEFLQVASHELRTPLTPLQLQLQLLGRSLRRDGADAEARRSRQMVDTCERQVRRLADLIGQLLDVSRIESGQLTPSPTRMDLVRLVRDVVERHRQRALQAGSEITLEAPEDAWGCWDPVLLGAVVENLLGNAIRYGSGRPIAVIVRRGDAVEVSVTDGGIGIIEADQRRIFERFERAAPVRHFGGLGLGLYISKRIIEAHHGIIRVESALGRGSTFTFEVPVSCT